MDDYSETDSEIDINLLTMDDKGSLIMDDDYLLISDDEDHAIMATSTNEDVRVLQSQASGYLTSPFIRVNVGLEPDQKEFFVHQDLVCPRSEFFMNAMKGPWKEAQERKVDLSEEAPETFALYLELLYVSCRKT
jgi:hypothetical protein